MRRTVDAAALEACRGHGVDTGPDGDGPGPVFPDYGGYCFAGVPGTAAATLGMDVGPTLPRDALAGVDTDVSHVVVLVLDGLGWHRFHRDRDDHRFLSRLAARGTVTPLTTVAPASTAAAITTVHTAATPAEHGVFGWDQRLPGHETVVEVFPHERRDASGEAAAPPVPASDVVRADPVYPALEAAGVATRVVQPAGTLGTPYADATFRGAAQVPYDDVADCATALRERLDADDGRSYTYVYVPDLDTASHVYGSDSGAYHDALATVTRRLSRALFDDLDADTAAETLLVATADHGFVDFDTGPAGCLDVLSVDGLADTLARRRSGDPVPPWGGPRLLHLAVRDDERARTLLEARGATVFTREEVRDLGLFGPRRDSCRGPDGDPGFAPDRRCGDLVCTHPDLKLLSPGAAAVVSNVGMHGGLTAREMLVPFAAARLSRLR